MTEASPAAASAASAHTFPLANALRALAMDAVEKAKSGHPGMPMGMADVAATLFTRFMKIDPKKPDWADRDRFILSAGHGSMLLYGLHHLLGYPDMDIEEIKNFRQLGARTAGHPEYGHAMGIETTTGPLGQGIATAVGMALTERLLNARFGDELVDHHTYVIAGDGCLMEGISHEAIDLAGAQKLGKLIVLWDDNNITIDGKTELATATDQRARFEASGWNTLAVDGHDAAQIEAAIAQARADSSKPWFIACKTIIGYGAPTRAGTSKAHGEALGPDEIKGAREKLNWPHGPFEIPAEIYAEWRKIGAKGAAAREKWEQRLAASDKAEKFKAQLSGDLSAAQQALKSLIAQQKVEKPKIATRKASEVALTAINGATELTLGGSADLTHSNLTITKGMAAVSPENYGGRYIHYGVREHGMAAAMNGIALHGGFTPYGGTFLVFSDYARGAIRLSALMGLRVIYVLTHDSIGLGEDGPTHQPVETVASLRAIPNLLVFRPADAVETSESWAVALSETHTPSALALSRQNLPALRFEPGDENLTARGAYVLRETEGARDITLLATGSEVEIALAAADQLKAQNIEAAVVSMPCWELFERQPRDYREKTLGAAPRIGIEAAVRFGWDRWLGDNSAFVGMQGFGASAPAAALYQKFDITPSAIVAAAQNLLA